MTTSPIQVPSEAELPDGGRGQAISRVSTLELFFDLVFVFAITQVSHVFGHAHGTLDFLRAFLVLAVVWWMYGGYAWLTSNVGTTELVHRVLLLCGMAGFLVMALRIPAVAERHGAAFGIAYLVVVLVHAALFTHAPNSSARGILAVLPFNLVLAAFVTASGYVRPAWNWLPWLGAGLAIVATTMARRERAFQLSPSHFVERHGLVVLIALGESVVATGAGAGDLPVGLSLVIAVVLGLALAAALWWSYFDRDDERAEHAMTRAVGSDRARLAVYAFYYAHLLMIAGIVLAAAGLHEAVAELERPTAGAAAWLLAAGVALYLVGSAGYRRLLAIGRIRPRLVGAALTLGSPLLGNTLGSSVQVTAVVALLIGMLVAERRASPDERGTHQMSPTVNPSGKGSSGSTT
jgi:low temperature requirement protein LtrA